MVCLRRLFESERSDQSYRVVFSTTHEWSMIYRAYQSLQQTSPASGQYLYLHCNCVSWANTSLVGHHELIVIPMIPSP